MSGSAPSVAAVAAAPPPAPPIGIEALPQLLLSLLLVVMVILLLAWLLRRIAQLPLNSGSGAVRILGGVALGQRERAVLLQVGERQLLVGVAPGQVRTLYVLPDPLPTASANPPAGAFAERLAQLLRPTSQK